jgi:hypothetical protein
VGGALYLWQSRLPKHHILLPEAYELYQQDRRHIQEFTEQSFNQSVVDFQNAVQLDPEIMRPGQGSPMRIPTRQLPN